MGLSGFGAIGLRGWLVVLLLFAPRVVWGQDDIAQEELVRDKNATWSVAVTLGVGLGPDFLGADIYEAGPGLSARLRYKRYWLELGNGMRANLVPSRRFEAGPFVSFLGGRNNTGDELIDGLDDIDVAVMVGGFIRYSISGLRLTLQSARDVAGVNDGVIVEGLAQFNLPVTNRVTIVPSLGAAYADDRFHDTYFGISPTESGSSGLAAFNPEPGLAAVLGGVGMRYRVGRRWFYSLAGSYGRLLGDAAASPVASVAGSRDFVTARTGLTVRF